MILLQRIEEFLRLHEIRRVEPLGEPAVDRREQITCLGAFALIAPELGEACRGAQLPRFRALTAGNLDRQMKASLGFLRVRPIAAQAQFAFEPM